MDVSYSIPYLGQGARDYILQHPAGCLLFGTDSPWEDPKDTIQAVRALCLPREYEESIFHGAAERLLRL